MKIKKFKVDIYEWKVTLMETNSVKDFKKVKKQLLSIGVSKDDLDYVKTNLSRVNGGDHFYHSNRKESILILYRMTSKKQRINILCHEKRHLEDRIKEFCHLGGTIEPLGYLAGYLGKMLI